MWPTAPWNGYNFGKWPWNQSLTKQFFRPCWKLICRAKTNCRSWYWKIPSVDGGNLVHLEVPASSSSGISFPVPLGGPSSNAVSRITCWLFSPCNGVRKTSRTGDHEWFCCYSSDLVKGIDIASTLEPVDTSQWPLLKPNQPNLSIHPFILPLVAKF